MKYLIIISVVLFSIIQVKGQINIKVTNPTAEAVLAGDYDPTTLPVAPLEVDIDQMGAFMQDNINPDSLKAYLVKLSTFRTRNSGSDTLSSTEGIGAARTWIRNKMESFGPQNNNRLLTGYLQFDLNICGVARHKNVIGVLPGTNPDKKGIVLIEAHMDSRCDVSCDVDCTAQGMEDNGSGTALVIELARVMGQLSYDRTIVFMTTTGEEQGLLGADAFADYVDNNNIEVRAVYNNDIVGGIICGETSSPPSCPGLNDVDSTQVRMFSSGAINSKHKSLCRFIKMQYNEMLLSHVKVPMMLTIMSAEDRTGRGGDHIPFRRKNIRAMRFTSANEHGNASNDLDYHDRQHTSDDVLGVDTNGDMILDSFFVDFNYLGRNAAINANAVAMSAIGPDDPLDFTLVKLDGIRVKFEIDDPANTGTYRVGVRTASNDFDSLYTIMDAVDTLAINESGVHFFTICALDSNGVESHFTRERFTGLVDINEVEKPEKNIVLLQNRPNPFDESTTIIFFVNALPADKHGKILIRDLSGKIVKSIDVEVRLGVNEILYQHGYNVLGTFLYSLVIGDRVIDTKKMIFAY